MTTMNSKRPPGDPMTLGNMRHLGVQRLVASCLNPSCRHEGLIDVSKYPDDNEVPLCWPQVAEVYRRGSINN
jgi:hypothetical protein